MRIGSKIPKPWSLNAAFLIIDGTCLLAVVLWLYSLFQLPFSWERLLGIGPGVFAFNEEGIRVDRTIDYGDDLRFRERWGFSWADLRQTNSVSEKVSCEGKDGQHE